MEKEKTGVEKEICQHKRSISANYSTIKVNKNKTQKSSSRKENIGRGD